MTTLTMDYNMFTSYLCSLKYVYILIYVVSKNNDHSHNMKYKFPSSGYSSVGGNQFLQNTAPNLLNNISLLPIRIILIFFTARTSNLLQSIITFCPTQIKSRCKSQKNIHYCISNIILGISVINRKQPSIHCVKSCQTREMANQDLQ